MPPTARDEGASIRRGVRGSRRTRAASRADSPGSARD
jgi:hypothetical protein